MRPAFGGRRRRCVVYAPVGRSALPCGRRSRGSVRVCRRPRSSRPQKCKGFTSGCAALAFFRAPARGVSLAPRRQYLAPPLRLFPVPAPLAPRTARPRARLPLLSSRRSGACGSQARKRGGGAYGARLSRRSGALRALLVAIKRCAELRPVLLNFTIRLYSAFLQGLHKRLRRPCKKNNRQYPCRLRKTTFILYNYNNFKIPCQ